QRARNSAAGEGVGRARTLAHAAPREMLLQAVATVDDDYRLQHSIVCRQRRWRGPGVGNRSSDSGLTGHPAAYGHPPSDDPISTVDPSRRTPLPCRRALAPAEQGLIDQNT